MNEVKKFALKHATTSMILGAVAMVVLFPMFSTLQTIIIGIIFVVVSSECSAFWKEFWDKA